MPPLFRRLRGLAAIVLSWGTVWALFGAALSIVVGLVDPRAIDPGEGPIEVGRILGGVGLFSGTLFGVLLAFAEGGRQVRSLSVARAALWGILASSAFPLLTGREDQVFVLCPVGAALAALLIGLARAAAPGGDGGSGSLLGRLLSPVHASMRDVIGAPMATDLRKGAETTWPASSSPTA